MGHRIENVVPENSSHIFGGKLLPFRLDSKASDQPRRGDSEFIN